MKLGNNKPSVLPGEGWEDILYPPRFVTSIQWFLTDLFVTKRGPTIFMYQAITIIRLHLESSILTQAWSSINRRSFSVVIIQKVQEL